MLHIETGDLKELPLGTLGLQSSGCCLLGQGRRAENLLNGAEPHQVHCSGL